VSNYSGSLSFCVVREVRETEYGVRRTQAWLALLAAIALLLAPYANKSLWQGKPRTPYTTQFLREPLLFSNLQSKI
jgi:hypothetical protein